SPMVRNAAASLVAAAERERRLRLLGPLLADEARLVRMTAGRALAGETLADEAQQAALQRAVDDYVAAQQFNAERPEARVNLGRLYQEQGDSPAARNAYSDALQLDPGFAAA